MKQINFPKWKRLDNTAKIFPSNSARRDSKVFRFSCELNETADPAVLQHALDKTLEEFPLFRSVMKKGFFWYYLEESAGLITILFHKTRYKDKFLQHISISL